MLDIKGIKKRVDDAEHYATCPKSRNECKRCDACVYSDMNTQSIIRTLVADIKAAMGSRDDISCECAILRSELDQLGIKYREGIAELDELRTRHTRLIDSTEAFVGALVDERFKKDHASMLAELQALRTKNIEASKRMRVEINAMPSNARAIFESARVEAKANGVTILRALVDMVVALRIVQMDRSATIVELASRNANQSKRITLDDDHIRELRTQRNALRAELDTSRNECREHLARINMLESARQTIAPVPIILHCPQCDARHIDAGEFAIKPHHTHACQSCGTVWRPAIVATVGVQFLPGFKDAQSTHVLDKVQDDGECEHVVSYGSTLPVNESTAHAMAKVEAKSKDTSSANVAPNTPQKIYIGQRVRIVRGPYESIFDGIVRKLHDNGQATIEFGPSYSVCVWPKDINVTESSEPLCTCPPTSEHDDPCPMHGIVGRQFAKHPDVP